MILSGTIPKLRIGRKNAPKQRSPPVWMGKTASHFYAAKEPNRPLIVSLHTWSGNYEQEDLLIKEIIKRDYNYIHPDFRGPNKTYEACGSEFVIQDIEDAIAFAIEKVMHP